MGEILSNEGAIDQSVHLIKRDSLATSLEVKNSLNAVCGFPLEKQTKKCFLLQDSKLLRPHSGRLNMSSEN